MATLPNINDAVFDKLAAASAITAIVSTRIRESQAPAGWVLPYLLFYAPSELHPNDTPRDDINTVYRFEAVAATLASAKSLIGAVYATFHMSDITVTGWSNYYCSWVSTIRLPVEQVSGQQFHRIVGEVRIRIARND